MRAFKAAGVQKRGDTSGWTMTPQQRAMQLENGSAGGGGTLLTGGPGGAFAGSHGEAEKDPRRAAATARVVDEYNASVRGESLVDR